MYIVKSKILIVLSLSVVVLLLVFLSFTYSLLFTANEGEKSLGVTGFGGTLFLAPPVLAQSSVSTTFLDREAGICAYTNVQVPIDLAVAKRVFRIVERESSDYIIGSIALPGLSDEEDVHCLIHRDGWIIVYYLKSEPVSKIIDWRYWSASGFTKNKLQLGLELVANTLKIAIPEVKYYHFQYPLANKLMIVADTLIGPGRDTFKITISEEIELYEASWSHYDEGGLSTCYFVVDGRVVSKIYSGAPVTGYGFLSGFGKGVTHVIEVYSEYAKGGTLRGASIVLVYREP